MGELGHQLREEAKTGAHQGAQATYTDLDTLREERDRYDARKRKLSNLAAFGLPVAFTAAVLSGLFFGSYVITALPNTWEWPCRIIGAEHRFTNDPSDTTTFCLIQRD